jgi:hypothetical protein
VVGVLIHFGLILGGLAVFAVLALAESKRIVRGEPRRQPIFRRSSRAIIWGVAAIGFATAAFLLQQPYALYAAAVSHIAGAIWTGLAPRAEAASS